MGFIHLSRNRGAGYIAGAVLCPVLVFVLGRVLAPYIPQTVIGLFLYTGVVEILLIGIPALLLMLRKRDAYRGLLTRPDIYSAGLVILSSAAYVLAAVLVTAVWSALLLRLGIGLPTEADLPPATGAGELAAALLCAAFIPAVCEELLFRGVMLQFFEQKAGKKRAVIICGFAFALLHFSFHSFAALAVIGLFLSALTIWYRNLWLAVIFHFLYNALVIVLQSLGGMPSIQIVFLCAGVFTASLYLLFHKREGRAWI